MMVRVVAATNRNMEDEVDSSPDPSCMLKYFIYFDFDQFAISVYDEEYYTSE